MKKQSKNRVEIEGVKPDYNNMDESIPYAQRGWTSPRECGPSTVVTVTPDPVEISAQELGFAFPEWTASQQAEFLVGLTDCVQTWSNDWRNWAEQSSEIARSIPIHNRLKIAKAIRILLENLEAVPREMADKHRKAN